MHPVKSPPVSRGRDRHVIAVPVLPDSVALEVAVVQQVFGRRPFPGAGDLFGRYQIVLCGGAFLLGRAGALDGRRATTRWLYSAAFREEFPLTRLEIDRVFVDDGSVHTCGGALSTADIALHLLSLGIGDTCADATGRLLVVAPNRSGEQLARDPHGQFMTDFSAGFGNTCTSRSH